MLRLAAGDAVALSDEGGMIRGSAQKMIEVFEESISLFGRKVAVISQIWSAFEEAELDDWDGEGARRVALSAACRAEELIRGLPDGFPLPEIAVEPDGEISLDWIESRNRLFSLSVGNSDRMAFAWIDGLESGHGVARSGGMAVASRILHEVALIKFPNRAPFWLA